MAFPFPADDAGCFFALAAWRLFTRRPTTVCCAIGEVRILSRKPLQFLRTIRNYNTVSTAFFATDRSDEFSCFSAANLPLNPRCAGAGLSYTATAK
jgi:hypothetical protein